MLKTICFIIVVILWIWWVFILGYSTGLKRGWKDAFEKFMEILKEGTGYDKD